MLVSLVITYPITLHREGSFSSATAGKFRDEWNIDLRCTIPVQPVSYTRGVTCHVHRHLLPPPPGTSTPPNPNPNPIPLPPHRRIRGPLRSSLREQHESKLLIKCMMECYRAHPSQVAMLMDMTTVFLCPTPVDFTFLKVTHEWRFTTMFWSRLIRRGRAS